MTIKDILHEELTRGIPTDRLPIHPKYDEDMRHAPKRHLNLNLDEKKQAIKNALRYFDPKFHEELAKEFAEELNTFGHIYIYRLRPVKYDMKAYSLADYPGKCSRAKAIMFQIMNNLDPEVAQFPHELITYGGNGSVFSNWAQYALTMKYLSEAEDDQTLIMYSGHPMGLFPSPPNSPIMIISNGMMVSNFSTNEEYKRCYAMGTTIFGQMTAGSYCYIGPQGIVHGTTITIMNAGRKYLGLESLSGKIFVSAGLGNMSAAQSKAARILNCIGVIAEVNRKFIDLRHKQGWVDEIYDDLEALIKRMKEAKTQKVGVSIAYHGNVVDLWERLAKEETNIVDLGSDQTSCHIPFTGGYYPVGYSMEDAEKVMASKPEEFKKLVNKSLVRHMEAILTLSKKGMAFWDYGNSFLLRCSEAGSPIVNDKDPHRDFIFPSYVQDIMGDVFSLGFGPFRWICTSNKEEDLVKSDKIAATIFKEFLNEKDPTKRVSEHSIQQFKDNLNWIEQAHENRLVVGSQARILYANAEGRLKIALAFNEAVRKGEISDAIVLSRDHHDVSGADSPFRETSNITDGSYKTADMSIHTAIGNSMRYASWVAMHNGGGTGWGLASNCGFGLVLDGSKAADDAINQMILWDVSNGLARRSWSGHSMAKDTVLREMKKNSKLNITVPNESNLDLDKYFK